MRYWLAVIGMMLGGVLVGTQASQAASLRIQPAIVKATLQDSQKLKGYVDIINAEGVPARIEMSVKGVRQLGSRGELAFEDDPLIAKAITLDYHEVELGPNEAMRLYYLVDPAVLPGKDIVGAIFARTISTSQERPARQAVQVGTVVVATNAAAPRAAEIVALTAATLQIGEAISIDFSLKNTSPPVNAYFPTVTVAASPYGSQQIEAPLVTAGATREVTYRRPGNFFGPMKIDVSTDKGRQSVWVLAVTGIWVWLAPLLGLAIGVSGYWLMRSRLPRKQHRRSRLRFR